MNALSMVPCMPGDHQGQKRASGFLELESQTTVSCHVCAGTEPGLSARAIVFFTTESSLQLPQI